MGSESERAGLETEADSTMGYTTERSLWRAATVLADESDPDSVSIDVGSPEDGVPEASGRYQIREVLGRGGMGEVRLCRDDAIGREVALKTLLDTRATSAHAERRFLREARVQGQLEHPSIVPVYDLGKTDDGGLYFTMRRVRGHTLAEVVEALARGEPAMVASYSRRKLLEAFVRVCLAVDYAHSRGVLHRDLKPSNIMLGDFGEVYVLDWGIARLVTEQATNAPVVVPPSDLAGQGSMVGTPGYMSPEQTLGLGESQDARTDVYSLGAILFEILTLRRMHAGSSVEEIAESTRLGAPVRPSVITGDVPPELDTVCARAAARSREDRYASARELCGAIERYLDGDRDLERRRELAAMHATAANAAFSRVAEAEAEAEATPAAPVRAGAEAPVEPAAAARADAVREVTTALALDSANTEARQLLVRLLVEAPRRMPPEVVAEMEAANHRSRVQFLRFGSYALASWALSAPLVIAIGVRSWPPVLLSTALSVISFVYAVFMRRTGNASVAPSLGLVAIVFAEIASVTCYMGPFVAVPQFVAVTSLYVALESKTKLERWAVVAMGALAAVAPFALEALGVVPPAYAFVDGNVTLFARAVRLSPATTIPLLCYMSLTTATLPAIFLGRVRDALSVAETKLFLQAWHLHQLVPSRGK
jgi:serine/threonine-protein kinase